MVKTKPDQLAEKLEAILSQTKQLEKDLSALKAKIAASSADEWLAEAKDFGGVKLLIKRLEGADAKSLRDTADKLKGKLGKSAVLLANVNDGKISLVAGVSKDATSILKAGDMVRFVAEKIGGKGGGRPDMAQGGGSDVEALPGALVQLEEWVDGVMGPIHSD